MTIKTIKELSPYSVDSEGNVYGLKGQKLKPYKRGKGYLAVDCFGKTYSVHRLVLCGFGIIPLEYNGMVVDHINEIKTDNRLENLQVIENYKNVKKSLSGRIELPKGVSYIKYQSLYRYTEYDRKNYPKGRILKSSKDLDKLLLFIEKRKNESIRNQ